MEKCASKGCAYNWICGRSELMSTPAQNTRLKKSVKNETQRNQHVSDVGELQKNREERQVIKNTKFIKEIKKRNALVSEWLTQTKDYSIEDKHKDKKASEVGSVKGAQQLYKQNQSIASDSVNASEVSEVILNIKVKEAASSNIKEKDMEAENSIQLGHSAMSGRSSTARRRAQKAERMKYVKKMHGMQYEETGDDVKLLDTYSIDGHDKNNHDILSACSQQLRNWGSINRESGDRSERSKYVSAEGSQKDANLDNEFEGPGNENEEEAEAEQKSYQSNNNQIGTSDVIEQSNHEESDHDDTSAKDEQKGKTVSQRDEEEEPPEAILDRYKRRLDQSDSTVFYDMFEMIIMKLSVVQTSIKEVRSAQAEIEGKMETLNNTIDVCTQSVDDIDAEIDEVNDVNIKLVQSIVKLESSFDTLEQNQKAMVNRFNKGCFILNGITVKEEEKPKEAENNFIKNILKVTQEIEVTSAHKMGALVTHLYGLGCRTPMTHNTFTRTSQT